MSDESLIRAMPDFVTFLKADGLITDQVGGRSLPFLLSAGAVVGRRIQELVDPAVGELIVRLVRRAIADRGSCESRFTMDDAAYLARVHAQGPDRTMCIIRRVSEDRLPAPTRSTGGASAEDFHGQLRDAVSDAGLRERPFALCSIFLDGLADIGQLIDYSIRQRILEAVLHRLRSAGPIEETGCTVGVIEDTLFGAVVTAGRRDQLRNTVESMAASLSEPVRLNDSTFTLSPHIGVAIFGQDASSPQALMDHARAAMLEARRAGSGSIQFYSDTLRMQPVFRLDIERELREAIRLEQIDLHYLGRHDLASGRITGLHAQMRWVHPLRGEIPPAQFLRIAETTDHAPAVSWAALRRLVLDLPQLRRRFGKEIRISFGPLRHHLSSGHFLKDFLDSREAGALLSGGVDLRIAERTLAAMPDPQHLLDELMKAGVGCMIDEMGSGMSSLPQLAQLPIAALQITRRFVVAAAHEASAMRTCRAIAALANTLGVLSIAPGIDDGPTLASMSDIGYSHGLGDLYPPTSTNDLGAQHHAASHSES